MKKLSLEETQEEVVRLLCEFSGICEREDLKYYLACGSCLGAVRHHGFIPWDDDADVYMPRADYEKLLSLMPTGNNCKVLNPKSPNYVWPYGKFVSTTTVFTEPTCTVPNDYGVFIDIFPLDGLPKSAIVSKYYHRLVCLLCHVYFIVYFRKPSDVCSSKLKDLASKTLKIVGSFIPQKSFMKMLHRLFINYNFDTSEFITTYKSQALKAPEIYPRSFFENSSDVVFEGHTFKTVSEPRKYLELRYGSDWMTPIARKNNHGQAWWRSHS